MANEIIGNEVPSKWEPASQVYMATHGGDGKRLPFMYRSFISFSYGGKIIEDFGLIAITDGDRLTRNTHADFEDVTETYDVIDGQIFWGTHHTNNSLELKLFTDGMTEKQLDDFKTWFRPGVARELILAEHPNRAIMARISTSPVLNILPFESTTRTKIRGQAYETKITLYKGEMSLNFVMDEPYWYAKHNIIFPFLIGEGANGVIDVKDDAYRIEKLIKENYLNNYLYITYRDNKGDILEDVVKIEQIWVDEMGYWWIRCESSVPIDPSAQTPVYKTLTLQYPDNIIALYTGVVTLGNTEIDGERAEDMYNSRDYIKIINEDNIPHLAMIKDSVLFGEDIGVNNSSQDESKIFNNTSAIVNNLRPYRGARIQTYGYIGWDVASWAEMIEIDNEHPQYLFYSGTAPSMPNIRFTFTPTFHSSGYINLPKNHYTNVNDINNGNYNYIQIGEQQFKFTTPSLLTGYNQAVNIVLTLTENIPFNELLIKLKEKINEYYARSWAIFCARTLENNIIYVQDNIVKVAFIQEFISRMKYLICSNGTVANPLTCSFNSKTGVSIAHYIIRATDMSPEEATDISTIEAIPRIEIEENAGDMVKSNYLIIDGRCYPNSEGWVTKRECHKIITDFIQPITGLLISFQNMYY